MTENKNEKITKDMTIADAVAKNKKVAEVLMDNDFGCLGCAMASRETLEEGFKAHGISDEKAEELIKKMNDDSD
jgi:hybrid cluster-associated redox disulfide protein